MWKDLPKADYRGEGSRPREAFRSARACSESPSKCNSREIPGSLAAGNHCEGGGRGTPGGARILGSEGRVDTIRVGTIPLNR